MTDATPFRNQLARAVAREVQILAGILSKGHGDRTQVLAALRNLGAPAESFDLVLQGKPTLSEEKLDKIRSFRDGCKQNLIGWEELPLEDVLPEVLELEAGIA